MAGLSHPAATRRPHHAAAGRDPTAQPGDDTASGLNPTRPGHRPNETAAGPGSGCLLWWRR